MSKKGILISLIVVVAIIVLIIAFGGDKIGTGGENGDVMSGGEDEGERGTETFDPTAPDESLEVTKPKVETKAAPGSEASLRVFEMTATKDGFDPAEIVVNQGDTISIKVQTAGVGYDIALPDIGLYQSIEKGGEKKIEFQALAPGTFTYLCRDMCPGGKEIKGSLIVKKK